jgi:TldD protein
VNILLSEDELFKIINMGLEKGAEFVDLRIEDYVENNIVVRDTIVEESSTNITTGASIRVLYRGGLGFASTNELSYESLAKTLESALRIARALSGKTNIKLKKLPSRHDVVELKIENDPRNIPVEDKISDLMRLNQEILGREYVKTITTRYADITGKTIYVSSEERYIEQHYNYTWLYAWATGRLNDIVASARIELGTRRGYELFNKYPQEEIADKLTGRVERQLKAATPRGGVYPAVLAPEVVGVFTHEAFGHLAEADLTMSGSILADKIGKKIVSELVTIIDDPTIPDAYGTFKYDDEGVEARPVTIVDKGVLRELMVDRKYAEILGVKPTGNARAEDYNVPPLIRMRTTYIKPGDMSIEELFEDIKYGYYLVSFRGGQANLDGTFQVGIQEAYEIVNGEIGRPVRNMSISGNTIETLKHVSGVGKDFEYFYGRCGKGQTVFVSDGGPHIRVDKILVGGMR